MDLRKITKCFTNFTKDIRTKIEARIYAIFLYSVSFHVSVLYRCHPREWALVEVVVSIGAGDYFYPEYELGVDSPTYESSNNKT